MSETDEPQDPRTVRALADAERLTGTPCGGCSATLCGHDAVFSLVLGYKNAARCLRCIAAHMREPLADLRERTLDYVRHHECFLAAWHRAGEREGFGPVERPACLWGIAAADRSALPAPADDPPAAAPLRDDVASWDAGDMGCGDLVLELRLRLRELPPGGLFDLIATDPGAPVDIPAWCNLTGHTLVAQQHPSYRIRRKS